MQSAIYTIGYQGATLAGFVTALKNAGVQLVLDIRAVPASRKKGFSKSPLTAHLAEAGIAYRHLRGLGTPKLGREAARNGDLATFEKVFRAHLDEPEALLDFGEACTLAQSQAVCLLCMERDPHHCHRLIVAERMAHDTGQTIDHLFAEA
jgi:uncharacterized protein (DUF488 family)